MKGLFVPDHGHIVSSFDEELRHLDAQIAEMGGRAEQLLASALKALEDHDSDLAETAIGDDKAIDDLERSVEEQAILMIARRQPMAQDLRHIIGAIRISSDLERVGDYAKNIAKRAVAVAGEDRPKRLMRGLRHMGELAAAQLGDVLGAYAHRDSQKALDVWYRDKEIDDLYDGLFRELLTYMMEDPRNISICTHLLFGAKNIERIGDHSTNIAELVHYLVEGEAIQENRPKSDRSSIKLFAPKSDS